MFKNTIKNNISFKKNYKRKFIKRKFIKRKFIKHKFVKKLKNYFLYKKVVKVSRMWIKCIFRPGFRKKYYRSRKNYFVWKKKKRFKSLRHKHNFFFFFTKKRKRWPRVALRWLKFQLTRFKKTPLEILSSIENRTYFDWKKRYPLRLKNNVLKKRALKLKLKAHYKLNEKGWNELKSSLKRKKNKILNIFFFLNSDYLLCVLGFIFFEVLEELTFESQMEQYQLIVFA